MTNRYSISEIARFVFEELKANRWQALSNTISGLIIVALDFVFVFFTKETIDVATGASQRFSFLGVAALLVMTLLVQILVRAYRSWVNAMLTVNATNRMQMQLFGHTLRTPLMVLKSFHSGDLINRIEKDVSVIVSLVTETLPSLLCILAQAVGAFIFLYLMDSYLAMFVVIVIPFFALISKLYIKKMRQISRQIRQQDSHLQTQYQEGITNRIVIKTIRNATARILGQTKLTQNKLKELTHRRALYSVTSNNTMNLGFSAAYLFAFVWGAYHISIGLITYGALLAFVRLVGQIQRPARGVILFIPDIINACTSAERILEIKELQVEKEKESEAHSNLQAFMPVGVRIENLSFGYCKGQEILKHLCFDFVPGSRTAIMGPTGKGKTTLIRLMLSLLTPEHGEIELYGKNLRHKADLSTRCFFAYVPQGNTLFSGTIRQNLQIANSKANEEALIKVLKIAQADFVFQLKEGLDSVCGEKGINLSEGQAQRLCIARALLLDAPILLLDEATSALDNETEAKVLEGIVQAFELTTIICISHRQKVLDFCDQRLCL